MKHYWLLFMLAAALLAGCASAPVVTEAALTAPPNVAELRGAVFDPPRAIADFTLPSTEGAPFTLSEHRGQLILIYFGYRACPDFCPTTFAELRRVYLELGEPADQLKIAFVTVDPERDTLENLTLYTDAFHQDFIGLRDDGAALAQLIDEFGVVAEKRQVGESALSYLIDHTASVFLIGPDGALEAQYLYGTDYRDIVHDLRLLLESA